MKPSLQSLAILAVPLMAAASSLRGDGPEEEEKLATLELKSCYTNMTEIFEELKDDSKLEEQKRFVICPNTVMDIGFLVPGIGIDKGQMPIVPRSNTEFICGEDGSSANNCVLNGGDFGVLAVPVFFRRDRVVKNVQIKGFTFRGQVQYSVFAAQEGDISIHDCIFEDSQNYGPMVFSYDREINDDHAAFLKVLVKDCTFQNLKERPAGLGVEPGIISIKKPEHDVTIENCLFQNNNFGTADFSNYLDSDFVLDDKTKERYKNGYAIRSEGAKLSLRNNCFIDNKFRGGGAVVLEGPTWVSGEEEGRYAMEDNFATEGGDTLKCDFVSYKDICMKVQTKKCGIEGYGGNSMIETEDAVKEERDLENNE